MGRVAIVTGGTRGIGKAICEHLSEDGFTVVANYAGNSEAAQRFTDETGIKAYRFDVGDHEAVIEGCKQIESEVGPIDAVVNNAGITRDGTLLRMTYEDWQDVMRIIKTRSASTHSHTLNSIARAVSPEPRSLEPASRTFTCTCTCPVPVSFVAGFRR